MRIPRLSFSESLQLIEVAAIVSATIFAGVQLRAIRLQNATDQLQKSADFALRLNQELDTDVNEKLEDDLDDPAAPILKEHGGKYTVIQLDNFLSQYETLDDLYQSHLITCRMLYNEFSGDLEDAYKNKGRYGRGCRGAKRRPYHLGRLPPLRKEIRQKLPLPIKQKPPPPRGEA
jgi:hypothetical protein